MAEDFRSRAPWATEPSLKQKTMEVGIDFDRFIQMLSENKSDTEIAAEFNTPFRVIEHLREHFERLGIHSVVGQD